MRFFFKVLFIFFFSILASCSLKQAVLLPLPEQEPAPIRDRYVFLVNLDGSRPQDLNRWVREGHLPNIRELFFRHGAVFENAINVYPTVSIPNHQAFISGLFPGHHGLPALDWFSRPLGIYTDYLAPSQINEAPVLMFNYLQLFQEKIYTDAPQTLFAQLTGHPTLSIMEATAFGASNHLPKTPPLWSALDFRYREQYQTIDFRAIQETLEHLRRVPHAQLPRFSFINFFGMDNMGHFEGPDSDSSLDLTIHYDRFFGHLVATLKERGIWEKSTLVLVSDHGQHYLHKIVSLIDLLKGLGLDLNEARPEAGQVVWGNHGTGTSNLYFKWGHDWKASPSYEQLRDYLLPSGQSIDLIKSLANLEDIEMVLLPESPTTTHLFTADQHARIERRWVSGQFLYRYRPDPGDDPLGYLKVAEIKAWVKQKQFRSAEDWLRRTADSTLPDALVAISTLFDDRRTGDMIVQAPYGVQFKESKISGHGSLHREDRRVHMMFHGPDIRTGRFSHIRIVDTLPTLLTLFGLKSPLPMDGKVRSEIFKNPLLVRQSKLWPRNLPNLSPQEFSQRLNALENERELNPDEVKRLRQLRHDLAYYQDQWRTALKQDSSDQEAFFAAGLLEEKPVEDSHGFSTPNHRRRMDPHERGSLPGHSPRPDPTGF